MSLTDLRADFTFISGRSDLTDARIDRYANRAQKTLDRRTSFKHAIARYFKVINAGDVAVVFSSDCRVIQEVWLSSVSDDTRVQLSKLLLPRFMERYNTMYTSMDRGAPTVYTPGILRTYPDNMLMTEMQEYLDFFDALPGPSGAYNGILFAPPADQEYAIEVFGKFYTDVLSDDNLTSWWTYHAYDTLLHVMLWHLEIDYRNSEGAADWERKIQKDIMELSRDDAEEEATRITAFEIQ